MKLGLYNRNFLKQFTAIALSLLLCQSTYAQSAQNRMLTFEGSLTDSGGNPINLQSQNLFFYITALDGGNNKCILFAESSVTSGDADGNIIHRFGGGSAVTSPVSYNHTLSSSVFSGTANGKSADGLGNLCTVPAGSTRMADVYSAVLDVTGSVTLGAAPYSLQADNASTLNGKLDSDFVLASSVSGGSTGQVLSRSVSGGFTWVNLPSAGSSTLPTFSGDVTSVSGSANLSVVGLQGFALSATAPTSGQALAYNGSQWVPTSVTPKLVTTNNLSDLTNLPIARTNLGLGSMATQNITATTPVSGQILTYNGSSWTPANANYVKYGGDTLNGFYTVDGGLGVTSTTTTNADIIPLLALRRQTSNASNGADNFGSQLLFEAENSAGNFVAQSAVLSKWTTATTATEQGQLEFQTRFNTSLATRMTITAGGKVGIGTTSPNAMLDVQGTLKIGNNGAGISCSSIELGVLRYNTNILEACNGTNWQPAGLWSLDGNGINYSNNVGIGATSSNSYRLNVQAAGNTLAYLRQNSSNQDGLLVETVGNSSANYAFAVMNPTGLTFTVKNDRKVGVNVNNPLATFHVSGTALVEGNTIVSGTLQLRSPASLPTACTVAEEGTQRYNSGFKVMEFCNGESWQGLNGVTSCTSGFVLIGTPGNPNAYCIDSNLYAGTGTSYPVAVGNCAAKANNRKTVMNVCTTKQLDRACEANAGLTSFIGIYHWTSDSYNAGGTTGQMIALQFISNTGICHISDDGVANTGRNVFNYPASNSIVYRCCYQ